MAELVARGPGPADRRRWELADGLLVLGRVAARSDLAVPWDGAISGRHVQLSWRRGRLAVRRLENSLNPVFLDGRDQGLAEFEVAPGQVFAIGATVFMLEDHGPPRDKPDYQLTVSQEQLRQAPYTDADKRIEVLAALPELIRFSPSDAELEARVAEVLVQGALAADVAGVVRLGEGDGEPEVQVVATASRFAGGRLAPSRGLVLDALRRRQGVFYRWGLSGGPEYTVQAGLDWALCAPLPESSPGWALYAAGRLRGAPGSVTQQEQACTADLKFAGVVADIFAALREVRKLQDERVRVQTSLSMAHDVQAGFFPRSLPVVPGYELAAAGRSAEAIGGDYYDVIPLGSGRCCAGWWCASRRRRTC
jgi:adenylate cyclase